MPRNGNMQELTLVMLLHPSATGNLPPRLCLFADRKDQLTSPDATDFLWNSAVETSLNLEQPLLNQKDVLCSGLPKGLT